MPKVIMIVDRGDKVSDLINAIQELHPKCVVISKDCQIDNDFLPAGAIVSAFFGTSDEVVEYLNARVKACAGRPESTHFSIGTAVTMEN